MRLGFEPARSASVPWATISPPLTPGPGPKSTSQSAHDRVLIVFDDDHRIADVAQPLQGGDQAVVVAGMQADRGLVEDVKYANQPGSDLAGQPNALGLAARKRRCRAIECQVVQTHVGQEPEPPADLLQQLLGDRRETGSRGLDRQAGHCVPRLSSGQGVKNPSGRPIGMAPSSTSVLPPTRTARCGGLSPAPRHSGQVMLRM